MASTELPCTTLTPSTFAIGTSLREPMLRAPLLVLSGQACPQQPLSLPIPRTAEQRTAGVALIAFAGVSFPATYTNVTKIGRASRERSRAREGGGAASGCVSQTARRKVPQHEKSRRTDGGTGKLWHVSRPAYVSVAIHVGANRMIHAGLAQPMLRWAFLVVLLAVLPPFELYLYYVFAERLIGNTKVEYISQW